MKASVRIVASWLSRGGHRLALTAALCVLAAVQASPFGDAVALHAEHRMLFTLREFLTPSRLDPRLKIFALDDLTVAKLGDMDLALNAWATVIEALGRRKPHRIFIDKLFDKPYPPDEVEQFRARAAAFPVGAGVISFVAKTIPGREGIDPSRPEFDLGGDPGEAGSGARAAYGARPALAPGFQFVGHALYDGSGSVEALLPLGGTRFLPHLGLLAADRLRLEDGALVADGARVPLADGRLTVDFAPTRTYLQRAFSLVSLVQFARAGKDITVVEPGDDVVILPAMYTGNTDWRDSPFGSMAGGYVLSAVVNSVLRGRWLTQLADHGLLVLVSGGVTLLLCELLPAGAVWLVGLGVAGAIGGLVFGAFVVFGILAPWLLPSAAVPLAIAVVVRARMQRAHRERARLDHELMTATLVQGSFFPERSATPGLVVAGAFLPASECGGDWWGRIMVGPGREALIIADATGHGVSAALVTAMAFAATHAIEKARASSSEVLGPAQLLTLLNETLGDLTSRNGTMTCLVCVIDFARQKLICSNASHNQPYMLPRDPADPRVKTRKLPLQPILIPPGAILGIRPDATYDDHEIDFLDGDRLVLFTDGLIENAGPGEKPWGKAALCRSLAAHRAQGPAACRDLVLKDAAEFARGTPPEDDTTLVVVDLEPSLAGKG